MSETAWIGLGSNLDTPLQQLHLALEALNQLPGSRLLDASPSTRAGRLVPQTSRIS